ncbi:MAG: hypothetical protein ACKE51_01410 [Methylococcaceae bacterium]
MDTNDFRQKKRRESERRFKKRRVIHFPFGSTEWVNMIQQSYLLWPKQDRRTQERRSQCRRQGCRRINNKGRVRSLAQGKTMQDLLSKEEKQMLNELIQSDRTD